MTFTDNNNLQNSDRMNVAKLFDGVSEQVFSRSRIQYSGLVNVANFQLPSGLIVKSCLKMDLFQMVRL